MKKKIFFHMKGLPLIRNMVRSRKLIKNENYRRQLILYLCENRNYYKRTTSLTKKLTSVLYTHETQLET